MHVNHPARVAERQLKRQKLAEIVSRLGENATNAEVKRQCYLEQIGEVNAAMLVAVRNELFPNRVKRAGGRPKGSTTESAGIGRTCPYCNCDAAFFSGTYRGQRKNGERPHRRYFKCRECGKSFSLNANDEQAKLNVRRILATSLSTKKCKQCKQDKSIEQFPLVAGDDLLRRSHCRSCANEARARRTRTNPKEMYGLTADQYKEMLLKQGGKCAICKDAMNHRNMKHTELCIDHCHETEAVRGLLCSRCNLGLGNFGDSVELMKAAIDYLESFVNQ